jgi:PEP-CTERM motif
MGRVVLLALLAFPTMVMATTMNTTRFDDRTAAFTSGSVQVMTTGTSLSLFVDTFNKHETIRNLSGIGPSLVVRDSYMTKVFSNSECDNDDTDCGTSVVPEPGALSLLATGLIGLGGLVRRKLGCQ